MMAKLAEDDRIEQMSAQRRRMRQQDHARAVQRMVEERQEKLARDKVRDLPLGSGCCDSMYKYIILVCQSIAAH